MRSSPAITVASIDPRTIDASAVITICRANDAPVPGTIIGVTARIGGSITVIRWVAAVISARVAITRTVGISAGRQAADQRASKETAGEAWAPAAPPPPRQ